MNTTTGIVRERLEPAVEAMREAALDAAFEEWLCWQEETEEHRIARIVCTKIEDRIRALDRAAVQAILEETAHG